MKNLFIICIFFSPLILASEIVDFSGIWETTYGELFLEQSGSKVSGWYNMNGICTVEGIINSSGRLIFKYIEPSASGEGWFEMSEIGNSFTGEWKEDGTNTWYSWDGYRKGSGNNKKWLIVLEVEWQESISENEYSFGEMLQEWFNRLENVEVRQRFFHSIQDLIDLSAEIGMLSGDVYLLIATHATEEGLQVKGNIITAKEISEALKYCQNLKLLHFSACQIMGGDIPEEIMSLNKNWDNNFIISGYTRSVDWAGSALIEFFYLDMILGKGFLPDEAAASVLETFSYAGNIGTKWMEPAGFKWIEFK